MSVRVCVFGGRDYNDYERVSNVLDKITRFDSIVCGEARGADSLGRRYAEEHNIQIDSFPAEWDKHGKRAGYIRNRDMANSCDLAIGFWDGKSRGTGNMIGLCDLLDVPTFIFRY